MTFIFELYSSIGYFDLPQGVGGWVSLGLMILLNIFLFIRWRKFQQPWNRRKVILFTLYLILVPLTSLFIGLRLPVGNALSLPGTPVLPQGSAMMFLAAMPWALAAGTLGPTSAGILAFLSGSLLAYYDSHNPFIPLIYMLLAMLLAVFVRQQFRTLTYRILRQPSVASLSVILLYPLLYLLAAMLVASGEFGVRFDYASSVLLGASIAYGIQLLWGGLFSEVFAFILPDWWYGEKSPKTSPAESSLQARILYSLAPMTIIFLLVLIFGFSASLIDTNRKQMAGQMRSIAESATNAIPFGLETGQNLIVQLAQDERILQVDDQDQLTELLIEYLNKVPFFNQLIYLDRSENLLSGYPVADLNFLYLTGTEEQAIDLALRGVSFQSYSLPPETGQSSARLVFVVAVESDTGIEGVVLGRTRLEQNPFFIPVLNQLDSLSDIGATGVLVDDEGMVLYHPNASFIGSIYADEFDLETALYQPDHTSLEGTREIFYQKPVPGRSWVAITTLPIAVIQQNALKTSLPLLVMLLALLALLFAGVRYLLNRTTRSITALAEEAARIAAGDLDHSLKTERVDEIGQLSNALDEMRLRLSSRMEEVSRLLSVSEGVASSLEMEVAVQPVLKGALSTGASAARLVLTEAALPEYDDDARTQFGLGNSAELYKKMDRQVLALTMQQPEVLLTNPARARLENGSRPLPASLLAVALTHENVQYGALWIAFDKAHTFTEEERRFLSTVAGQAALAAANARLYVSAELGRQRMEAILTSTPEPVLVTDHQDHLMLVNPAAQELLGKTKEELEGQLVKEITKDPQLIELLTTSLPEDEPATKEITFPDKRTFFGAVSPVLVDGEKMGQVCLLRDITHFKELDALKSDFVDTVKHDLRSPLIDMRNYANILDMVGDLNEQQTLYVSRIVERIENVSHLVNTLLDLGRIEAGVGLQLELLPMTDVVQRVGEALQVDAMQKHLDYQINLPDQTFPLVEADSELIVRALQNLVDNAIKFTEPEGQVQVTLRRASDEHVEIEVKDNGIGISPIDLPRVFERFYRSTARKAREASGTGLGLAIVRSIAERHHGSVTAESQLGKGSTFTLRLPIRQPEAS